MSPRFLHVSPGPSWATASRGPFAHSSLLLVGELEGLNLSNSVVPGWRFRGAFPPWGRRVTDVPLTLTRCIAVGKSLWTLSSVR